jgi:hypothetical protein
MDVTPRLIAKCNCEFCPAAALTNFRCMNCSSCHVSCLFCGLTHDVTCTLGATNWGFTTPGGGGAHATTGASPGGGGPPRGATPSAAAMSSTTCVHDDLRASHFVSPFTNPVQTQNTCDKQRCFAKTTDLGFRGGPLDFNFS